MNRYDELGEFMGGNLKNINLESSYDFQDQKIANSQILRHFFDHAVREIKACAGAETEVQVKIEPEFGQVDSYAVSVAVFGLREPVLVEKDGKSVMAALRKVKKTVLRKINRLNEKRFGCRRKLHFREQFAS